MNLGTKDKLRNQ